MERGLHQLEGADLNPARNSSGSLAIFAAIRRASSLVGSLAADRRFGLILEIDVGRRLSASDFSKPSSIVYNSVMEFNFRRARSSCSLTRRSSSIHATGLFFGERATPQVMEDANGARDE